MKFEGLKIASLPKETQELDMMQEINKLKTKYAQFDHTHGYHVVSSTLHKHVNKGLTYLYTQIVQGFMLQ